MNTLHVKKGDAVIVLSGNDKGKQGAVLEAFPRQGLVLVEGVGMSKKHQRPRREGQRGQIVDKHHPIRAAKVMTVEKHKLKKGRKAKKK